MRLEDYEHPVFHTFFCILASIDHNIDNYHMAYSCDAEIASIDIDNVVDKYKKQAGPDMISMLEKNKGKDKFWEEKRKKLLELEEKKITKKWFGDIDTLEAVQQRSESISAKIEQSGLSNEVLDAIKKYKKESKEQNG